MADEVFMPVNDEDGDFSHMESENYIQYTNRPTYDTENVTMCKRCKGWRLGWTIDKLPHKPDCPLREGSDGK